MMLICPPAHAYRGAAPRCHQGRLAMSRCIGACLRVLACCVVLTVPAIAAAQGAPRTFAGKSLGDALKILQERGLNIVYSSELVRPEMRVNAEPTSTTPRRILDELLAPHRLRAMSGAKGALVVIRAPAPSKPVPKVPPPGVVAPTLVEGIGYVESVKVVADPVGVAIGVPPPSQLSLTTADLQDLKGVLADDPLRAIQALPGVATGDDFKSEFSVRASDFSHIGTSLDGVSSGWLVHSVRGLDETGSVSIVNGDVIARATLMTGAYPQRRPGVTGARLDLDLREGSRDKTSMRLAVSGTTSSVMANGPIGSSSSSRGSWIASARVSYLQWLLRVLDSDNDSVFSFADVQAKGVYDLTPSQQLQLTLVGGRARLKETAVDPGPNAVGIAVNRTGLLSGAWRGAFSRIVITQRVAVVGMDFVNHGRLDQELSRGASTSTMSVTDATVTLSSRLTAIAGASVERMAMDQTYRNFGFTSTAQNATFVRLESSSGARAWRTYAHAGVTWRSGGGTAVDAGAARSHSTAIASDSWSPWLVVSQPIGSRFTLRASASRAAQMPDLDRVALASTLAVEPERANAVDVAIEHRITPNVRWQVTAYERRESDVLRLDYAEPRLENGRVVMGAVLPLWRNALTGRARGVEAVVERRGASSIVGWLSYAYGRARYDDAERGDSYWADFDQRHTLNAFLLWRASPRTSVGTKLRVGSNFPLPGYFDQTSGTLRVADTRNNVRLPAYSRLDVRLNHDFVFTKRRLSLFAEVINVLGRTNYGASAGTVRVSGSAVSFMQTLLPFLPSIGFVFDF